MIIYIFIIFLVLGMAFFFTSYLFAYRRLLKGEAPFVPVSGTAILEIIKALGIKDDSVVYDLGCGDGRILFAGHKLQPKATYVGLEKNLVIFLCAWIRTMKMKKPHRIKIFKKDFFSEDISKATHVFTYLMPKMMKNLAPKLQKELAAGTRLVSYNFPLKNKNPSRVIGLKTGKLFAPSKLYVYDF